MRTTVTLDKDVERLLREAMHRSRRGFKDARPMGLRPGLDPAGFNKLADELEVDAFLAKAPRPYAK